eukprot:2907633-Prymnesium_polylepis.1
MPRVHSPRMGFGFGCGRTVRPSVRRRAEQRGSTDLRAGRGGSVRTVGMASGHHEWSGAAAAEGVGSTTGQLRSLGGALDEERVTAAQLVPAEDGHALARAGELERGEAL